MERCLFVPLAGLQRVSEIARLPGLSPQFIHANKFIQTRGSSGGDWILLEQKPATQSPAPGEHLQRARVVPSPGSRVRSPVSPLGGCRWGALQVACPAGRSWFVGSSVCWPPGPAEKRLLAFPPLPRLLFFLGSLQGHGGKGVAFFRFTDRSPQEESSCGHVEVPAAALRCLATRGLCQPLRSPG